jgi:hypothetical protein
MDTPKVEPLDLEFEEAWKVYSRFIALVNRPRLQKARDGLYCLPAEHGKFLDLFKTRDDPVYSRSTNGRIKTRKEVAKFAMLFSPEPRSERAFAELHLTWEAYNAKFKEEVKKVSALAKKLYEVAKPIMEKWEKKVATYDPEKVPLTERESFLEKLRSQVINPWNDRVLNKKLETIPTLCLACGRPVFGRARNRHKRQPALWCTRECAVYWNLWLSVPGVTWKDTERMRKALRKLKKP